MIFTVVLKNITRTVDPKNLLRASIIATNWFTMKATSLLTRQLVVKSKSRNGVGLKKKNWLRR